MLSRVTLTKIKLNKQALVARYLRSKIDDTEIKRTYLQANHWSHIWDEKYYSRGYIFTQFDELVIIFYS